MGKVVEQISQKLYRWIWKNRNTQQQNQRMDCVRDFLHHTLPVIESKYAEAAIIEHGKYNYYVLPSGGLPLFDFVLPEHLLYVVVGDLRSAVWEEARVRGVSRADWEAYQGDLAYTEEYLQKMAVPTNPNPVVPVIVRWGDSTNAFALKRHLDAAVTRCTQYHELPAST